MQELPIDKRKLIELTRQSKHFNIAPIFLPEYVPEPGESIEHPISLTLADLVEEAVGYLEIATNEEIDALIDSFPAGFAMIMGRKPEWDTKLQCRRVATYYLVAEVTRRYFSFREVVENGTENEVLRICPELEKKLDKDGLLVVDDDLTLHDGGIEYGDYMLHYHQLLRREYTANPNFDFLMVFVDYHRRMRNKNIFRIAIDWMRIMPKKWYSQLFERDTWYGPHFSEIALDESNVVGLTIVKRNQNSLFGLSNKLDRTEFYWSFSDGIKTFETEEVSLPDYAFEHYRFNRYVHAERDIQGKFFRHLDGAVKVYLENRYDERFTTHLPKEPHCYKKPKLWRIDGVIDLDAWKDLISFFFKGNEMVIEYLNPQEFKDRFDLRVRDFKEWKELQEGRRSI